MAVLSCVSLIILCVIASFGNHAGHVGALDIGVNYGTLGSDLPSPTDVVNLYKQYGIAKMRIFNPDHTILDALRGSDIGVTIGVANEDIANMAAGQDAVEAWFNNNVAPYLNDVTVNYNAVGNEVDRSGDLKNVFTVMPLLNNVVSDKVIKVTTVVSASIIETSYPPSQGAFTLDAYSTIYGGHSRVSSINEFASDDQCVPYPANDGQSEANNCRVVVSESGWPSDGSGSLTTPELAATYNKNLLNHTVQKVGTPRRPGADIEAFIFAMFNENQKPAGEEQNFSLFYPNIQPVYNVFS